MPDAGGGGATLHRSEARSILLRVDTVNHRIPYLHCKILSLRCGPYRMSAECSLRVQSSGGLALVDSRTTLLKKRVPSALRMSLRRERNSGPIQSDRPFIKMPMQIRHSSPSEHIPVQSPYTTGHEAR